eukprot:2542498-Prymnesium_polylepis.1
MIDLDGGDGAPPATAPAAQANSSERLSFPNAHVRPDSCRDSTPRSSACQQRKRMEQCPRGGIPHLTGSGRTTET